MTRGGAKALARHAAGLRRLPPAVALFQARAFVRATRARDEFSLVSAARPAQLALLLRLAGEGPTVVELGTATGWTAASFVLAHPGRTVLSFDPVVQAGRDSYLALLPARARARVELFEEPGAEGSRRARAPVDLLFVDSSHDREATVAEFEAWRPQLAPAAVVALHDFGHPAFPGVAEAVAELGLDGEVREGMFVWRPGDAPRAAVTPGPPPPAARGR